MTKSIFRVICKNAVGARNVQNPELGLQEGTLYDVVADVTRAKTARVPDGSSSGYVLRNSDSDSGVVLAQIFRRDRFVREDATNTSTSSESAAVDAIDVGDQVLCVNAEGARSRSQPKTMLEQDELYEVVADVQAAATARDPDGTASGFMVKRVEDDAYLAGIWDRSRFARP